jgi:hypothetical protein
MSPVYGTVNVTDDGQVGEYERTFYHSYAGLPDNKLVRLIWDWDDARQRARTRIPYADQVIYSERDADGRLTGAMAVNLNWPTAFQGQAFGFAVPDRLSASGDPGGRCCEILNVMLIPQRATTARESYRRFISDFGYRDLRDQGFDVAYSTCARRLLRPYQRLGARLLGQTAINGEDRYFLCWPLGELVC